ncbi:MAG: hypothetical protein U9R15_17730 [Chloroflexota bacterium]|nr:hypothetical protein [Chloroflexota bacterium]
MEQLLEQFAAHLRARDRGPYTVKAYSSGVAALFAWLTGQVGEAAALELGDVTPNDCSGRVIVRFRKGLKYGEIPLHKEARKSLVAYLEVRPDGSRGDPGGRPLFLGQCGSLEERVGINDTPVQMRLAALVLQHNLSTGTS